MENKIQKLSLQGISLLLYLNALNLFVVFLSLYFSAFFIFSNSDNIIHNFRDIKLHGIIFSSLLSIAAGYIINHYYDEEKDSLNKPLRVKFSGFISKKSYLYLYLTLNSVSLIVASLFSIKLIVFFVIYQFFLWFYSHKLSKMVIVKNITKVFLVLMPFLALVIHFQKFNIKIILFAALLCLLLLIKDVLKDIRYYLTDIIFNYQTIPNTFGMKNTRIILISLILISLILSIYLSNYTEIGDMIWYFKISNIIFIISVLIPSFFNKKIYYITLEWIFKIWIFVGVISIVLIDWKNLPFRLL